MSTLTFSVIDLNCEAADARFFPPRISMTTVGTKTLRTRRGYPAYSGNSGVLYKKCTYTGYSLQVAKTWPDINHGYDERFCGGLRYLYSGADEIDIFGNFLSHHRKDMYLACTKGPPWPETQSSPDPYWDRLWGYCWADDPNSCSGCSDDPNTWGFKADWSDHSPIDYPLFVMAQRYAFVVSPTELVFASPTHEQLCTPGFSIPIFGTVNFPFANVNALYAAWITVYSCGKWGATLSDEFTAADELASQIITTNNSYVAENFPNYTTWKVDSVVNIQSRYTQVAFTLHCSNLIPGRDYTATYQLMFGDGTVAIVPTTFNASDTTHDITGTLPTPGAGMTVLIRNPHIDFA